MGQSMCWGAGATSVPVGNFSFETEGQDRGTAWASLPAAGDWVDGNPSQFYEIHRIDLASDHFSTNRAPGGTRVLNLVAASPMTNDLVYAVTAGDVIVISYVLGDSARGDQVSGNVEVAILVNGVESASETVDNSNAAGTPDGGFKVFKSVLTATSSGNLSIRFTNSSGQNWLDMVDVAVTPAGQIPVGNFSFESEGTASVTEGWYHLPDIGPWVKGGMSEYQISDISGEPFLFNAGVAPEGDNVLNLTTSDPLTQDLGYAVSSGLSLTIDFHLGDSKVEDQVSGNVEVAILVDGVESASETVDNSNGAGTPNGGFKVFKSVLTATDSGNLSIRFTNSGGDNWLDNVNVTPASGMVFCIQ